MPPLAVNASICISSFATLSFGCVDLIDDAWLLLHGSLLNRKAVDEVSFGVILQVLLVHVLCFVIAGHCLHAFLNGIGIVESVHDALSVELLCRNALQVIHLFWTFKGLLGDLLLVHLLLLSQIWF